MKTRTFPYGETPREVIEAQFEEHRLIDYAGGPWILYKRDGDGVERPVIAVRDTADLLTVLDALRSATMSEWHYTREESRKRSDAANLRISILAALGIEEG